MYPVYFNYQAAYTPEIQLCKKDMDLLGTVNDLDSWYITKDWAENFKNHYLNLEKLAHAGNPIAQSMIATLIFQGYLCTSEKEYVEGFLFNISKIIYWLERSIRQGNVSALDFFMGCSIYNIENPEFSRLQIINDEIIRERENGVIFPLGELWRRAYKYPIHENPIYQIKMVSMVPKMPAPH